MPTDPYGLSKFSSNDPYGLSRFLQPQTQPSIDLRPYGAALVRGISGFTPGGWIGAGAGALGELAAQTIEGRPEYNLAAAGTAGAINAIPFGSTANLLRSIGKGALLGTTGSLAMGQAEQGLHVPTAEEIIPAVGIGGILGGAGGAVGHGLGKLVSKTPTVESKPITGDVELRQPPLPLQTSTDWSIKSGEMPLFEGLEPKPTVPPVKETPPAVRVHTDLMKAGVNVENYLEGFTDRPYVKDAVNILKKIKDEGFGSLSANELTEYDTVVGKLAQKFPKRKDIISLQRAIEPGTNPITGRKETGAEPIIDLTKMLGPTKETGPFKATLGKEGLKVELPEEGVAHEMNFDEETPAVSLGGSQKAPVPPPAGIVQDIKDIYKERGMFGVARQGAQEARQLQTILDMSFPFRQGITNVTRPEFWRSFIPMFKSLREKGFNELLKTIEKNPYFKMADEAGVEFTNLGKKFREETATGILSEKYLPPVAMSNRTYAAFANKLRMDLFANMAKAAEKAGVEMNETNAAALARYINDTTGRGKLPLGLEKIAPQMNELFFSPKLIASRINMFRRAFQDPRMIGDADPRLASQLRKEAIRAMIGVGALGATASGLSSIAFDSPETADPRSTDFGKLKRGDTRLDFTGGFQQYVRAATQIATGMNRIGSEVNETNRKNVAERFSRAKLAPIASLIVDWMDGENVVGEKFTWTQAVKDRITPLIIDDLKDVAREDPEMFKVAVPAAIFGVGTSSYGKTPLNERRTRTRKGTPIVGVPQIQIPRVSLPAN